MEKEDTIMTMKLRLISDIHLEYNPGWIPPTGWKDSDLGILAGDIGSPYNPEYKNILIHTARKHKVTVLVPGNHEYYNEQSSSGTATTRNIDSVKEKLKELCRDTSVILLDNSVYDIGGGLRLIGSTLWPRIPPEYYPYIKRNKHGLVTKITKDMFPLTVEDLEAMNRNDINFLKRALSGTKDSIVVTHYPPSSIMLKDDTEHLPDVVTHWTEALDLVKSNVKLWACGHCHTGKKFLIRGNIPLVANCVQGGQFDENFEIII